MTTCNRCCSIAAINCVSASWRPANRVAGDYRLRSPQRVAQRQSGTGKRGLLAGAIDIVGRHRRKARQLGFAGRGFLVDPQRIEKGGSLIRKRRGLGPHFRDQRRRGEYVLVA